MKAFFVGLGTGYAIGTLWAPKSGREARQDLRSKAGELRDKAGQQVGRLKEAVDNRRPLLRQFKREAQP